jgi:cytochrome b pre-mRNA-processing protein 3
VPFPSLFRQRQPRVAADRLYAALVAQARQPAFYGDDGVADTVAGRFELYSVHVILLLRRLRGEGPQAAETAQALFDTFISGLDNALREIGVGDLSVARRMRELGQAFYGRAKAYDAALAGDSDAEALEALIGRTVFQGEAAETGAGALTAYVRATADALATQPLAGLLEGEVAWLAPRP